MAQAQKPPAERADPGIEGKKAQQTRSAAAGGTAGASELFRQLDRNRDGYLSEQELWSERGERGDWAAIDRNRDGRISPGEFTVFR